MKTSSKFLAILAASAFAFLPVALHAQDQPPPPMDNGGAPPPPDGSAAPPPPDGSAPPPPDAGAPAPDQGGGDSGASFQEFYDQLGSQGQWVQTDNYGYAFQPNVTDPNWAPYTDGHWVYTDVGWTWASDEPWGWATYHYGRWVNIDGTGWVWVPGYQWAPAWVSWRYGGGYCGWAPLPPSTFVGVEFGGDGINLGFDFHFGGDCDTAYGIGPGCYNFIPVGYIGNPYYHGYYLDRSRNFVVINNTRNITNIYVSRGATGAFGGVKVEGPALADVNKVSHTPVQQARLAAAGQAGRSSLAGGTLSVFAPHINPGTLHQARPANIAKTIAVTNINRGTSVKQPLAVNASLRPAAPSEEAIRAAQTAMAKAPASVATAARIKSSARLTTPLTSMQTTAEQRQTRATNDIQNRQQQATTEQANRQEEATDAQARRQEEATAAEKQRQQEATTAQDQRQQEATAAAERQRQAATAAQDQRQQEATAAAERQRQAATQEQDQRQQEAATAAKERQEAATNEQAQRQQEARAAEERATQERAAASQQRAPATQEHAPVQQQRAPVEQERPAPAAQHPAAAQGNGQKQQQGN